MYTLPRILVIDDLFGRQLQDHANEDRANLCGKFLLKDVTGDEDRFPRLVEVRTPRAEAVFYRGQYPLCSAPGDIVENDLSGCIEKIREGWVSKEIAPWSLLMLDLCFYTGQVSENSNRRTPGMPQGRRGDAEPGGYFGLRILDEVSKQFPDLPVVIFSSKSRGEVSLQFSNMGALGFLAREGLKSPKILDDYLYRHGLIPDRTGEIIGNSKSLLLALRTARRLADQDSNVLIRGERGTGKENMARYLHRSSIEKDPERPYVTLNSAIFSPELFASELFGIEAKTATGVAGKPGLIKSANGGDLFLDEVKDMPQQVQAGVLRVLQERQFTPVGGRSITKVNVRFISATNADLEYLKFRTDLLDRLREAGTIWLPPLKERLEDIPALVEYFVRQIEATNERAMHREITPQAIARLQDYDWPGNIRELRSVVFEAVNSHPDVEHFVPSHIRMNALPASGQRSPLANNELEREIPLDPSHLTDLDGLLNRVQGMKFDSTNPITWSSRFQDIQTACARLQLAALKAALEATARRTASCPEGETLIHPAMKLLSGDDALTASKAADIIKRIFSISRDATDMALHDSRLREAHETAHRLRPSRARKKPQRPNRD